MLPPDNQTLTNIADLAHADLAQSQASVAVLLPCFNEAETIESVVLAFRQALPFATIHVFDNNSSDGTGLRAKAAGAIVHSVKHQGKGNVVRRMFADVEADLYVLADGDGTYDANSAPLLIETLRDHGLDMVVATSPRI